jgi:exodeoxyribonuclease X
MQNIFFIDTETTSKDTNEARVVEIAIISHNETIEEKIKPPTPITIGAMATHHITEKMLEDKRPFCDSYAHYKLREYIDR